MQDLVYKTLRLVRISLLISAITNSFAFFYKSNRKRFSCVCIAWYKLSRRWENSRLLSKPSTLSRVYITVSNSPSPSCLYIMLCKNHIMLDLITLKATPHNGLAVHDLYFSNRYSFFLFQVYSCPVVAYLHVNYCNNKEFIQVSEVHHGPGWPTGPFL